MSAIFKDEAEFLRYKKELEDGGILELLENKHKEFEGADYKKGIFWEGKGGAVIPKDKQPGWIIPKHLKKIGNCYSAKVRKNYHNY